MGVEGSAEAKKSAATSNARSTGGDIGGSTGCTPNGKNSLVHGGERFEARSGTCTCTGNNGEGGMGESGEVDEGATWSGMGEGDPGDGT